MRNKAETEYKASPTLTQVRNERESKTSPTRCPTPLSSSSTSSRTSAILPSLPWSTCCRDLSPRLSSPFDPLPSIDKAKSFLEHFKAAKSAISAEETVREYEGVSSTKGSAIEKVLQLELADAKLELEQQAHEKEERR